MAYSKGVVKYVYYGMRERRQVGKGRQGGRRNGGRKKMRDRRLGR